MESALALPSDLIAQIRARVDGARFPTESEVVRLALRALEEREHDDAAKLEDLRREIQIGLDQVARGEVKPLDMDAIDAEVEAYFKARDRAG